MSFGVTLYGPGHFFWARDVWGAWFYRPDEHSTGGVGFCVPGLHVSVQWGHRR